MEWCGICADCIIWLPRNILTNQTRKFIILSPWVCCRLQCTILWTKHVFHTDSPSAIGYCKQQPDGTVTLMCITDDIPCMTAQQRHLYRSVEMLTLAEARHLFSEHDAAWQICCGQKHLGNWWRFACSDIIFRHFEKEGIDYSQRLGSVLNEMSEVVSKHYTLECIKWHFSVICGESLSLAVCLLFGHPLGSSFSCRCTLYGDDVSLHTFLRCLVWTAPNRGTIEHTEEISKSSGIPPASLL